MALQCNSLICVWCIPVPVAIHVVFSIAGRYFGASPFTLAVQINSKRVCVGGSCQDNAPFTTPISAPSYMYYVNDGVYGSFNCVLYDHATVSPLLLEVRR